MTVTGRFNKVNTIDEPLTIGCLGNLDARELSKEQVRYMTAFYTDGQFLIKSAKVVDKVEKSLYPIKNYNNFLIVEVEKLGNMLSSEYEKIRERNTKELVIVI